MKLSEALELCIDEGFYGINYNASRFMCHALESAGHGEHVPDVMKMVNAIDPYSSALAGALELDIRSWSKSFELCKAHYIKWIAELKEQGK